MSVSTDFIPKDIRDYMLNVSLRETEVLAECRESTSTMSMARMQISPEQGQFMAFLVKLIGAKRCLDVGVFTGYSSTVVAMALPEDGKVIGIDTNKSWTQRAKHTWREAGVADKVELILERADLALQDLIEAGEDGAFDFAFIDADKKNYDTYYEQCLQLLRPGGLIMLDNMLYGGQVIDSEVDDENTNAIRALNKKLRDDERVDLSFVPMSDGLVLARKR